MLMMYGRRRIISDRSLGRNIRGVIRGDLIHELQMVNELIPVQVIKRYRGLFESVKLDGICLRMCYFWTANLLKNVLNVTIFRMFSDKLTAKSEQIPKALAIFLSCMIIRAVR